MRSFKTRRWGPLLAIVLLTIAPAATAAITPQSDVLLPWFEVDLQHPDSGLTTTFSLVNASPGVARSRFTVYTNWGIPVLEVPLVFERTEAKTIDLRAWIVTGVLPNRTLTAAELAHLHAALTGKPSPTDGLYYGSAVPDGMAVGYVVMQTLDQRPDSLWGDTYSIDADSNYFEAETLTALTHGLQADCSRHGIRYVNEGRLYDGAELIIWSGRSFQPSSTPFPAGPKMKITIGVYDQAGRHVQDCLRELIAVEPLEVCHLDITPPIGWLDVKTEDPTFILQHLHSTTQASAELHSYCLPASLELAGPGISLEKRIDGSDADRPGLVKLAIGENVGYEYEVTNTGTVALSSITVTDDMGLDVTCPKYALDPGESMVCTARAIAEGCLHGNVGTATGTAPDGTHVTAKDRAYYEGVYHPRLTLQTLVNGDDANQPPGASVAAGDPLHWTFVVTNGGDARISDISVALKKNQPATCPKTTLEPGETMTCTADSIAEQGQHGETGTASGTDPCASAVSASDPAHYFGRPNAPGIDIEKLIGENEADTPPGVNVTVGTTIQWRFLVTNTGNLPLTNIVVTDDQGLAVTCPKTALEPGESMTCTASSVALACEQKNTASATASASEKIVKAHDAAHYFGEGHPALTLELKLNGDAADDPPGAWIDEGATIQLTYEVTNTGDVELSSLVVSDDRDRTATCPKTVLQPGESMTCTSSMLAVAGTHDLLGSAYGRPPCGDPVEATDPAYYRGRALAASIDLTKRTNGTHADTPPGPSVPIGSTVQWTYVVTNTGTVALTNVSVTDTGGVAVTCPKSALEPGESMTCTASGIAQACQYANTATAEGHPAEGEPVTARDDGFYYGQPNARITVDKRTNGEDAAEAPGVTVDAGSTIEWTFIVTNTGDVPLTDVAVTDDRAGTVVCPKAALAEGESMTCAVSGPALSGPQRNVASASGKPPCGDVATATDASHYLGVMPSIRVEKLVNGEDADDSAHAVQLTVGADVLWSFVVTNTGDVALSDVAVTDNPSRTITCPKTSLQPGESMTCTATGVAAAGLQCDTGTATGTSPQSTTVTSTDSACYRGNSVGDQGCTPGYWKNHTDSWPPAGYSPSQTVVSVFSAASAYPALASATLLQSLGFAGGSDNEGAAEILLRAATAALLNAAHPGVSYPRTPASVISDVNNALASSRDPMLALAAALDADNNSGCPLN